MNDVELMYIVHPCIDLLEKLASFVFLEPRVSHNIVKELPPTGVFHNEVELLGGLNYFIELDNVRMSNQFKNVDLSGHSFDVRDISDSIFLQNFDCNLLSG
jgi:hypothetical protein